MHTSTCMCTCMLSVFLNQSLHYFLILMHIHATIVYIFSAPPPRPVAHGFIDWLTTVPKIQLPTPHMHPCTGVPDTHCHTQPISWVLEIHTQFLSFESDWVPGPTFSHTGANSPEWFSILITGQSTEGFYLTEGRGSPLLRSTVSIAFSPIKQMMGFAASISMSDGHFWSSQL